MASWLEFDGLHTIVVDVPRYIAAQPVQYCQVGDVMDAIRAKASPVYTYIDITELNIRDVDLIGLVDIIWDLHERTKGEEFLKQICFIGASRRVMMAWRTIKSLLPVFISELIIFE
jgi:hypothetical protein